MLNLAIISIKIAYHIYYGAAL